ncbi:hypothetical protein [uncultured Kriegella sp.]|uniref:hypothetical protein n=1 Tax=uncultured Kriegella sp. TaxID=1798910 RepID=UPI0030D8BE14|tara:strand:+ start:320898 stop:321437 length:540 start_codon:yes stop_codon:yes gene_type:complete
MEERKIIISEGNRPFWQSVIASFFYTISVVFTGMFFFGYEIFPSEGVSPKWDFGVIWLAIACTTQGVLFSSVKRVFFDLDTKRYKVQYSVGPIHVGRWTSLPNVEYVSVFQQAKKDGNYIFETNLWYQKNKHFNVYESIDPEPAFAMGKLVALKLNLDLLDATQPKNYVWVKVAPITQE